MEVFARASSSFRDDEDRPGPRFGAGECGTSVTNSAQKAEHEENNEVSKRLLLIPAVALVMALGLGAAAGLTVTGGPLQQGTDADLTCDAAVTVGYTLTGADVTSIEVGDIDAACVPSTVTVETNLGPWGSTAAAAGSVSVAGGPSSAASITSVTVTIN